MSNNLFGFGGNAQSSSPFGNVGATTSGQTGSSLFGTAAPAASSGTSLFAHLNQATTSAGSGASLFGSAQPATASTSTGGGLFGSLSGAPAAASNATGSGGLFGSTQPAASGTSLFGGLTGNAATSQPAVGGGIFANLGGSTTAANSTQPVNSGSGMGGSLFGATQPQQQQTGSQEVKTNGTKSSQSAHFDHLLERSKKRASEQNGHVRFNDLPSLQLGLGDIARKARNLGTGGPSSPFGRGNGENRANYLLSVSGINSTSTLLRDLNSFNAQVGASATATIASRLETADTDLDSYIANLRNQSTLELIAEGLEQSKRDFDIFLEESVQLEWDKQRRRIYEHFGLARKDESLGDSVNGALDDDSGAFGRGSRMGRGFGKSSHAASRGFGASGLGGFGASGLGRSVIGTPKAGNGRASIFGDSVDPATTGVVGVAGEDRFQRERQMKFAHEVQRLNAARMTSDGPKSFPVLQKFADVEQEAGMDSVQPLVDSYAVLIAITGETNLQAAYTMPGAIQQRAYRSAYADIDEPSNQEGLALRKRIIDGSRRFLEKQFLDNLNSVVAKNPREAQLGGVPSMIDKVRGYVRILASRKELGSDNMALQQINGDHCYVVMYTLLRCGLVSDAKKYVLDNQRAFQHLDLNFQRYVTAYADGDRQLSADLSKRIMNEYKKSLTKVAPGTADPYKVACYKIIGRVTIGVRTLESINSSWEDWMWLQFALAREQARAEASAGEMFGLDGLRETVREIGNRHFKAGANSEIGGYGTYFFLQILVGRWENAVAWLYQHDVVAAVHFAIALNYYGLLRVADLSSRELLSTNTKKQSRLQFGLMIGYYTAPFRTARPLEAVDYLTLIATNADLGGEAGKQQSQLCYEALRELVLETREFASLLGDVESNGKIIPGAILKRKNLLHLSQDDDFIRTITTQAASMAEEAGRTTDAVLLFHLASQYDAVISIVNRALSEAISVDLGSEPMKLEPLKPASQAMEGQPRSSKSVTLSLTSIDDPLSLARTMATLYTDDALKAEQIKRDNKDTCGLLIRMAEAKRTIERGQWREGCHMIADLGLLPLMLNERESGSSMPATTSTAMAKIGSPTPAGSSSNVAWIRDRASVLSSFPPALAHTMPALLMMSLTALSRWRSELQGSAFIDGDATRRGEVRMLGEAAKDLMVYAGLVRYKLPGRVFEKLGEVVGEEGG